VLSFTAKHFGEVPEAGELAEVDRELLERAEGAFARVGDHLAAARFRAALGEALDLAREANRYLEVKAPWSQMKEDRAAAATTLNTVLQAINALKILLAPFLPFSAQRLHEMLGYETSLFGNLQLEEVGKEGDRHGVLRYDGAPAAGSWAFETLPAGRPLEKPRPLFKKLDPEVVEEELARMG
jgi:methionyl-tRNA synthetase